MTDGTETSFVYVTFIRTTPEQLWSALTNPETMKRYWFGMHQRAEWKKGAAWQLEFPDGRVADSGVLLEVSPARRLVIQWRNEFRPELKSEGFSRCTIELEPMDGRAVKLTVLHVMERAGSKLIDAVAGGWPRILSNLKSLLEMGEVVLEP